VQRRAKIIATVGPATADAEVLADLLRVGTDVVRLNVSHGSTSSHRELIHSLRQIADRQNSYLPILVDLKGPRYRLAVVPDGPRELQPGQRVSIGVDAADSDVPVDDDSLLEHLRPGERILIDNGLVELRILGPENRQVMAQVIGGGPISSRKGINLPDSDLPFEISSKDLSDMRMAVEEDVDFLAASYVGSAADLEGLRKCLRELGGDVPIVAKLERARAVENVEEIVAAADAVMVARGDLGVEVALHRVPLLQKSIIDSCRRAGKPVIVATQMLESMMEHPRPTRAESSDVANAVLDGADALLLSGETAAGRFPVRTVETMARIICEAESYARHRPPGADRDPLGIGRPSASAAEVERPERGLDQGVEAIDLADATAGAAVFTADHHRIEKIVAFSQSGFTAVLIARYRPDTPILVFTTDPRVARRVQLLWGSRPIVIDEQITHHDEVVEVVERHLLAARLAKVGDRLIVLMGDPIRERPLTNLMRLHTIRSATQSAPDV
jgi:pyruvate kinase